jgi:hypothetical protein
MIGIPHRGSDHRRNARQPRVRRSGPRQLLIRQSGNDAPCAAKRRQRACRGRTAPGQAAHIGGRCAGSTGRPAVLQFRRAAQTGGARKRMARLTAARCRCHPAGSGATLGGLIPPARPAEHVTEPRVGCHRSSDYARSNGAVRPVRQYAGRGRRCAAPRGKTSARSRRSMRSRATHCCRAGRR